MLHTGHILPGGMAPVQERIGDGEPDGRDRGVCPAFDGAETQGGCLPLAQCVPAYETAAGGFPSAQGRASALVSAG